MAAMSKAYALYSVAMNAPETFSNVYASVSKIPIVGAYLAPVMAGAALGIQLAQAASIQGINFNPSIAGMAHSGIDNIPKEGTWLLDQGERVLSPRQNQDLTKYLNARRESDGANITINNNTNTKVTAQQGNDGRVYVTIDEVEQFVSNSLARPNSRISKSMQQNTNAGRRR